MHTYIHTHTYTHTHTYIHTYAHSHRMMSTWGYLHGPELAHEGAARARAGRSGSAVAARCLGKYT